MSEGKIKRHLKLEKGALIYLIGGKHIGVIGKLMEIKKFKGIENDRITMETKQAKIETLKDYAFVIEKVLYDAAESQPCSRVRDVND